MPESGQRVSRFRFAQERLYGHFFRGASMANRQDAGKWAEARSRETFFGPAAAVSETWDHVTFIGQRDLLSVHTTRNSARAVDLSGLAITCFFAAATLYCIYATHPIPMVPSSSKLRSRKGHAANRWSLFASGQAEQAIPVFRKAVRETAESADCRCRLAASNRIGQREKFPVRLTDREAFPLQAAGVLL
jgi:hypothetical protein